MDGIASGNPDLKRTLALGRMRHGLTGSDPEHPHDRTFGRVRNSLPVPVGRQLRSRKNPLRVGSTALASTIDSPGAQGDGIGRRERRPLYLANALPGARFPVRGKAKEGDGLRAEVLERPTSAGNRVAAPCQHFGICGGYRLADVAPVDRLPWSRPRAR
ncbi:MAG: hypothetical protein GDA41_00795 [Rhodospirillales bacterium]|nr:hypothetical protein [Rhodospirillales bacterium]